MPTKQKKKITVRKPHKMIDTATESMPYTSDMTPPTQTSYFRTKQGKFVTIAIVVVLILLGILIKQGYVVAAIVNGSPIFRYQLNSVLMTRFGKQVLDRMVNETLVASEAKKAGVSVTQQDIDTKTKDILAKYGGMSLDDLLKYQGMTKDDFNREIRLQMTIEKLLGKDIQIAQGDVDNFIATNRALLTATDPAVLQEEARQAILSQKISEKFQTWFTELRTKASVVNFLSL